MPTGVIRDKIRETKRFAEVIGVLLLYGFEEALDTTGLEGLLGGIRARFRDGEDRLSLPPNTRVRLMLEDLGPTFIKLGQILSTRPDLVPVDLAEELEKLQEDCPRVEFAEIAAMLDEELGGRTGEILASIDETPLAAGSMAQVHRAVLADGAPVVLKILRPGVEDLIAADLGVLNELAAVVERFLEPRGFNPRHVVEEFARQITRELDLTVEARSTERLALMFEDDPNVSFPHVHPEASTQRVLALEEIAGVSLAAYGQSPGPLDEREAIVENGADAVFSMCLEQRFFHADPHAGNIFSLGGGRICFIDCGMVGRVDQRTAVQLAQLVHSVIGNDLDRVIQIVLELSAADPTLRFDRVFRTDASEFIAPFQVKGESMADLQFGKILTGFFDLLRKHRIECPADLVYLIKALTTIEGVGRRICPEFDLVGHVRPRLRKIVMSRYSPEAVKSRLLRSLANYTDLIEALPAEIRSVVAMSRRQDFAIALRHQGLDQLTTTLDRAARSIAYGLVIAATILAGAVLIHADRGRESSGLLTILGGVALGVVAVIVLMIAGLELVRGRRRRRSGSR